MWGPIESIIQPVSYIVVNLISSVILEKVATHVKGPFIDEIFHLRQCETYCRYEFGVWDSKITTPPGLYLLGFGFAKLLSVFSDPIETVCENHNILRLVNLIGGELVLPIVLLSLPSYKGQFWVTSLISMPLLFPYYFLFYTDPWSLVLTIACLSASLRSSTIVGGLLGFASLWFRQTNIIWIAFVASVYIDKKVNPNKNVLIYAKDYVLACFQHVGSLAPFVLNFVLFGIFLKVNGGITFGDKENHQIQLHLVQVFYCFVFISIFTWPSWLSVENLKRYVNFVLGRNLKRCMIHIPVSIVCCIIIKYIIANFTVVHPFLLADNRHYTFYIWKKILSKQYTDLLAVPIYHFATWNIVNSLVQNTKGLSMSPITIVTFLVATVLTIVPSPLFEPRYYITPLVVFRLFTGPERHHQLRNAVEFVYVSAVNSLFFYVFFGYEFTWASEPGEIQRIIW
ncbi:glucosyltransferase [Yamadazyma tenuis]|nr:glucosyltransferase [Yamadazyma tenuis]